MRYCRVSITVSALLILLACAGCPEDEKESFSLETRTQGQGTVVREPDTAEYSAGTAVIVRACAATGWHFDAWSGDLSGGFNPAAVTMNADKSVTAVFAADLHTLYYAAGQGGTLEGAASQTVAYGSDGAPVTAVADVGRHFVQWSDGVTDNPRTDVNVTADVSVGAEFVVNDYTLTYGAGEGGALEGEVSQTVAYGGDGTPVTAIADTGYHFEQWSDGVTDNPRTDTNVTADVSVTAEFAEGTVVYVNVNAAKTVADGSSWVTAFPDLQSAMDAAPSDGSGELWVAAGAYTAESDPVLTMKKGVKIFGGFAGTETRREQRDWKANGTIIDGEQVRRCVIGANDATLDGFTVRRGTAPVGGGMCNLAASPTVTDCSFTDNMATSTWELEGGGAVWNESASPVFTDCIFHQNGAEKGGGAMANVGGSNTTITHCVFSFNTGAGKGAMWNWNSSPHVTDCLFAKNKELSPVPGWGGAMCNFGGASTVDRCYFLENGTLGTGGALYNGGTSTVISNCVFAYNRAFNGGGGLASDGQDREISVTNCTFVQNEGTYGGGGLLLRGNAVVTNCIVWGNISHYRDSQISGNGQVTYSCVQDGCAGEGNIASDPEFLDLAGGSLRLREGSPCIDNGIAVNAPETDFLGHARPEGAAPDMGACEGGVGPYDMAVLRVQTFPAEGGSSMPSSGIHLFGRNDPVWLLAQPRGMRFADWTGSISETLPATRLVMDKDKSVTATFTPNIFYVNGDTLAPSDGRSWETAFNAIQKGVDAAALDGGGEVRVAGGTYGRDRSSVNPEYFGLSVLVMKPGVSVLGGFSPESELREIQTNPTVMDGANTSTGCVWGADNATLDGFVIANESGLTVGWNAAGGMTNHLCSPTVTNCTFKSNYGVENGGAMCNIGGAALIENCVFEGNTVFYSMSSLGGGAIYNLGGAPTISECLFNENTSGLNTYGGAICNAYCAARILRSTFSGNRSGFDGGAIYSWSATLYVEDSVFFKNSASGGGAIDNGYLSSLELVNCSFTGNASPYHSGAISNSGVLAVRNCVLWGDTADGADGTDEIFTEDWSGVTSTVSHSCIQGGYVGAGNIDADPLFFDEANGNLRLQEGSPCIDTGNAVDAPAVDIEGTPRPQGAGVDMGAYER